MFRTNPAGAETSAPEPAGSWAPNRKRPNGCTAAIAARACAVSTSLTAKSPSGSRSNEDAAASPNDVFRTTKWKPVALMTSPLIARPVNVSNSALTSTASGKLPRCSPRIVEPCAALAAKSTTAAPRSDTVLLVFIYDSQVIHASLTSVRHVT